MTLPTLSTPFLPTPSSWFPGHMRKFTRILPTLLTKTDIVLELRDSRLPLTSINGSLEDINTIPIAHFNLPKHFPPFSSDLLPASIRVLMPKIAAIRKWRYERGYHPSGVGKELFTTKPCEHIVVFNKRDLVPQWGIEPFRRAMARKFPSQTTIFASYSQPSDIKELNTQLVNIARQHVHSVELNVLVVGMPNVGKSTLLNTLRHFGIKGPTAKAFRTSANPGHTQAVSTRLRLSLDPLIYAYDSPGVMLPFLGRGQEGAERGAKLALIAGIKEGLYDMEALASYLLYRLNVLNPISPAYLDLAPPGTKPTSDLTEFLALVAQRMGMIRRGAEPDLDRAAVHFIRWWRAGGSLSASPATVSSGLARGWGFDCDWADELDGTETPPLGHGSNATYHDSIIQAKMEGCIDRYLKALELEETYENNISPTQQKKRAMEDLKKKRAMRYQRNK